MTEFLQILAVCLLTAFLAVVLKGQREEYALAVAVSGGVVVTLLILKHLAAPLETLRQAMTESGVTTVYFKVALKALGIGYVTGFVADACRDSGQTSLAAKAELAGKCAIFLLSLPMILQILEAALALIR
ncbi:MAG: hypothetical protein IJT66_06035 [Clostridia bacterium]|nr:hypothetical protein [Clostridia bacterium]